MNQRLKDLSAEARKLKPAELADLVDDLLVALQEADPGWSEAWAAEAERRMDAYRRGDMPAYPIEHVVSELRKARTSE